MNTSQTRVRFEMPGIFFFLNQLRLLVPPRKTLDILDI